MQFIQNSLSVHLMRISLKTVQQNGYYIYQTLCILATECVAVLRINSEYS
jgi:hypothetical protein